MDNLQKYNDYRKAFPEMVYDSYHYDVQPEGLHISFCFTLQGTTGSHTFHPSACIAARPFVREPLNPTILDTLVFHIGMVELISYWKCACPPVIRVKCGRLTEVQLSFWRKLYFHGLGEFFWTNGIPATQDNFVQIYSEGSEHAAVPAEVSASERDTYLLPIGGGKDSVVTLEALAGAGKRIVPLIMNPRGATVECAAQGGFPIDNVLVIRRMLDPLLLDLNAQGMLNGHTPFSAMLAFYTLLASAVTGISNVALSNESSANESTVPGTSVNHQYSKSLEFENDFRRYVETYIGRGYRYFSFLRPLSELQIAMLFAREQKYDHVFKSCNIGSKSDIWCGHCAKCLFAYIILSPFMAPERLESIFGKNLLDDSSLSMEFRQLTGMAPTKPFECVGTVSEVQAALHMTLTRYYPQEEQRPALLKGYSDSAATLPLAELQPQHNLSPEEAAILQTLISSH